jgi:hypothetical protein
MYINGLMSDENGDARDINSSHVINTVRKDEIMIS